MLTAKSVQWPIPKQTIESRDVGAALANLGLAFACANCDGTGFHVCDFDGCKSSGNPCIMCAGIGFMTEQVT